MSLERRSVHVRLAPAQHEQLSVLAGINDKDMAELAAEILEQGIVGRFHTFNLLADKLRRLEFGGIERDSQGAAGK
jgi:hypothetical protein